MVKNKKDINKWVASVSILIFQLIVADNIWKFYGYKKAPKVGKLFIKLLPEKFKMMKFIERQTLIMGLIDVMNAIKKSRWERDIKILLAIAVIDKFCYILSQSRLIKDIAMFIDEFFSDYLSIKNCNGKNHENVFIDKAQNVLNEKDFVTYAGATIYMFATPVSRCNLLLDIAVIKDEIDNDLLLNTKFDSHLSEEVHADYVSLIESYILT